MKGLGRLIFVALACATGGCASAQSAPTAATPREELQVERVVMLMRHGIRPPTRATVVPAGIASDAWPTWSVPVGHLTDHGYSAIRLLGAYDRTAFAAQGVLPAQGCPAAGEVFVHSDADERTIRTGDAMIEGLFPGCTIANEHLAEGETDVLYSPLDAPGGLDGAAARQAILTQIGSVDAVRTAHRAAFDLLQRVVGCCSVQVCQEAHLSAGCRLGDLPTDLVVAPDEGRPKLTGLLDYSPTAAQVLMLEYVEGMPMAQVGWGRATRADIQTLMALHSMKGEVLQRNAYVGAYGATPLMRRMLDALEGVPNAGGSRYTLLVGHDTNISDLSGMLGFDWQVESYPANTPPPGGGVGFELLRDSQGRRFVRAFYRSQTMDQMRNLSPLSLEAPAFHQYLSIRGCSMANDATMCSLETFEGLVRARFAPQTP